MIGPVTGPKLAAKPRRQPGTPARGPGSSATRPSPPTEKAPEKTLAAFARKPPPPTPGSRGYAQGEKALPLGGGYENPLHQQKMEQAASRKTQRERSQLSPLLNISIHPAIPPSEAGIENSKKKSTSLYKNGSPGFHAGTARGCKWQEAKRWLSPLSHEVGEGSYGNAGFSPAINRPTRKSDEP